MTRSTLVITVCVASAVAVTAAAGASLVRNNQLPTAAGNARTRVYRRDAVLHQPEAFPRPGGGMRVLTPLKVEEGPAGDVYVLDFADRSIKEFSPDGAFVRRYGKGMGRGPGELLNPTDFHVAANGDVWVLDPVQGRMQVFAADGSVRRTMEVDAPTTRFVLYPGGRWTALTQARLLFASFDSLGHETRTFGRLLHDQLRHAIVLQGEVVGASDGGVLFGPVRGGYLARWSPAGELRYYRRTVDPIPFPDIEYFGDGASTVKKDERQRLSTVSASVQGDDLYVLTGAKLRGHTYGVIDVYALRDGGYRYTFVSPQRGPRGIHVTPRWVYVVSDTTVTRWPRTAVAP